MKKKVMYVSKTKICKSASKLYSGDDAFSSALFHVNVLSNKEDRCICKDCINHDCTGCRDAYIILEQMVEPLPDCIQPIVSNLLYTDHRTLYVGTDQRLAHEILEGKDATMIGIGSLSVSEGDHINYTQSTSSACNILSRIFTHNQLANLRKIVGKEKEMFEMIAEEDTTKIFREISNIYKIESVIFGECYIIFSYFIQDGFYCCGIRVYTIQDEDMEEIPIFDAVPIFRYNTIENTALYLGLLTSFEEVIKAVYDVTEMFSPETVWNLSLDTINNFEKNYQISCPKDYELFMYYDTSDCGRNADEPVDEEE